MKLFKLNKKTKLILVLGLGYPILGFVSVISLSFCIDKMQNKVCAGLMSNVQTVWTMWIFCTLLLLILIFLGKKK